MSFLDSVLTSLETGKPSPLPVSQPPSPPSVPQKSNGNSIPVPTAGTSGVNKRKAQDQLPARPATRPAAKPIAKPTAKPIAKPVPRPAAKPVSAPAKPAPKGSYADIMAQAKARQAERPTNMGGAISNKKVEAKYTHRQYQQMLKESKRRGPTAKAGRGPPGEAMRRKFASVSPKSSSRKSTPEVPAYRGTAKKTTQTPEAPAYRGTAGLPGRNGSNDRRQNNKRSRNEYLGTDEEDEGDDYGGYDDYYSDASSDMEAGFDDVEQEDRRALTNARKEDEEEARLELAAKKEKLARQQRLAALASRKR